MPWNHCTYSHFVKDEDDFVGKIAYTLYKERKIAWIENTKKENGGTPPSEKEIYHYFISNENTEALVQKHIDEAKGMLQDYVISMFDTELTKFKESQIGELEDYKKSVRQDHLIQTVQQEVAKGNKSRLESIKDGLIVTFLSSAIVIAVTVAGTIYFSVKNQGVKEALIKAILG